jgi:uncharacterized membrane protein YbhN (UPF0104 family)
MHKHIENILFAAGIGIFIYMLYDLGIGTAIVYIKKTGLWLFPIIGLWTVVYLFNTLSMAIIIGRKDLKSIGFGSLFSVTVSGFAINYITPFISLGGEPYRALEMGKFIGKKNAASAVVSYKVLQWVSHLFLWIFTLFVVAVAFPVSPDTAIWLLVLFVVLSVLMIFMIVSNKRGMLASLCNGIMRIDFTGKIKDALLPKLDDIKSVDENTIRFYTERKISFFIVLFIEFFARILSSVEFYFIVMSVGGSLSLMQAVYINSVSSFIMNVMFFMPLEMGAREGSLYFLMQNILANPGLGIYSSLINRIRELFWILIGLILMKIYNRTPNVKIGKIKYESDSV